MLREYKINYAILDHDLSSNDDLMVDGMTLEENEELIYIRDNFEIIKRLNTKDHLTGSIYKKVYIYKRHPSTNT